MFSKKRGGRGGLSEWKYYRFIFSWLPGLNFFFNSLMRASQYMLVWTPLQFRVNSAHLGPYDLNRSQGHTHCVCRKVKSVIFSLWPKKVWWWFYLQLSAQVFFVHVGSKNVYNPKCCQEIKARKLCQVSVDTNHSLLFSAKKRNFATLQRQHVTTYKQWCTVVQFLWYLVCTFFTIE